MISKMNCTGERGVGRMQKAKVELYHDNFQNYKRYGIPSKAQLVIADIPYNIGEDAYGSNPMWYKGGDNANGESKFAKKAFFRTDSNFNIAEYFHFCSRLLKKEPKERNQALAMIVFCSYQQIPLVVEYGKRHGFMKSYPLYFIKNYSAQALKAHCWGDGDGDRIVSRQAAEVSQCGCGREQTDGIQSFRVEARQHESLSEDSSDAEARESTQAAHWDFHGRGRRGNRSRRRERRDASGLHGAWTDVLRV